MPADLTSRAAELEAQAAELRAQQDAEDNAAERAWRDGELEALEAIYGSECDQARQSRDEAIEAMNTAAAAGEPLATLYELFVTAMQLDAQCGSLAGVAPWLDRVNPVPRPEHQRNGRSSDHLPRPGRCASLFGHLAFTDWLSGVERQRRDQHATEADQRLAQRVRAAADKAAVAARKKAAPR